MLFTRLNRSVVVMVMSLMLAGASAQAAQTVELLFNGDWETELNKAGTTAGRGVFNAGEISTIEGTILSELERVYADYDLLSFSAVEAASGGSTATVIDFSATTGSSTTLGLAGLDFGNLTANQTVSVYAANFAFFINEYGATKPAASLTEIGRGLGGTAAHELGHSFGLPHGAAYGVTGVSTANYNNTNDLQNASIMATGSTNLNEAGREAQRELSDWSRVLLDVAGGVSVGSPEALVTDHVDAVNETAGDAGNTAGTAQALTTVTGPTSGVGIALVHADLDGAADTDFFSLTIAEAGYLSAEIWSLNRWGSSFDSTINIFDTDGSTLLYDQETSNYDDDVFGDAVAVNGSQDPLLLNLLLDEAGTYYIQVLSVASAADNDDYDLVVSFNAIPEPATLVLLAGCAVVAIGRRRRR